MKRLIIGVAIILASCNNSENELSEITTKIENGDYKTAIEDLKKMNKETSDREVKNKIKELFKQANDKLNSSDYEKMKANRQDKLYLDFKFGMTEEEAQGHAEKLIESSKVKPLTSYDFTIGSGSYAQRLSLEGYDSQFSPANYSCTGLIRPNYSLTNLNKLEIILFNYPESKSSDDVLKDVIKMFSEKYGDSQNISTLYTSDEKDNIKYYTVESNKAIYISEALGFVSIVYEDLISKYETVNLLRDVKSIQEESNIEKSKEIQNEI
jgi:hypothetical protein